MGPNDIRHVVWASFRPCHLFLCCYREVVEVMAVVIVDVEVVIVVIRSRVVGVDELAVT